MASVSDSFEIVINGTDNVSNVFNKITGGMGGLSTIAHTVSVAVGTFLGGALDAGVQKIKQFISSAHDWANVLDDMGDVLGTSTSQSAAIATAIGNVGGNVDAVSTQFVFLARGLETAKGQLGPVGLELKNLGLNLYDAKGNLKDVPSILSMVSDKFASMPDGIEKSALMTRIFGRSGKDLSDVMNELANGGLARADEQAKALGLSLGDEQVANFKKFDRIVAQIMQTVQGFGVTIGVAVLPLMQKVADAILGILRSQPVVDFLNRLKVALGLIVDGNVASGIVWLARAFGILNDEQVATAGSFVAEWQGKVMDVLETLKFIALDFINIFTGNGPMGDAADGVSALIADIATLGNMLGLDGSQIEGFLLLLQDLGENILSIFEGPLFEDTIPNIADDLGQLAEMFGLNGAAVSSLVNAYLPPLISNLQALGALIVSNSTPILIGIAGVIAIGLVSAFVAWAAAAATAAIATLAAIAPIVLLGAAIAVLAAAWINDFGGIQEITASVMTFIQNIISAALTAIQGWWAEHGANVMTIVNGFLTFISNLISGTLSAIQTFWAEHGNQVITILAGMWEIIQLAFSSAATIITGIIDLLAAAINGDWTTFASVFTAMTNTLWNNMRSMFTIGATAVVNIIAEIIPRLLGLIGQFMAAAQQIGASIIQGMKDGVIGAVQYLIDAVIAAIKAAIQAAKDFLNGHSPARRLIPLGQSITQGIALGITSESDTMASALRNLPYTLNAPVGAMTSSDGTGNHYGGDVYNITINDREGAALALAFVSVQKRARLNATMGG